ncbi:MAG: glycosyltransferase family 4 protein [Lachnospiraceae bacterium]|nr:glycosyltransferase family 4 protein [Lachnospiraceae bacterium]
MSKKIAFINQRYGVEVLGGSETYTRKTAEALALRDGFDVEVLTSKALDFKTWADYFEKDVEEINGVTVRRFSVKKERNRLVQRSSQIMMHNLGIHTKDLEEKRLIARGPFVPELVEFIKEHKDEYDAFVFVTYLYYPAYFGAKEVYDKAVFVPTAHDEEPIYMNIFDELFNNVKGIVYLTEEEKKFVNEKFHNENVPSIVNGMGIEIPAEDNSKDFCEKNGIDGRYIVYCGRIEENKGVKTLIDYVQKFNSEIPESKNEIKGDADDSSAQNCSEPIKLVLTGKGNMSIPEDENIKYLGFVSDEDKFSAMKGSMAICLPSEFESFSITLLEGMGCGKPALVNAKSEVLKGHIEKSEGGFAFGNYEEFKESLNKLLDEKTNSELGKKAYEYVNRNYSSDAVISEFSDFVVSNIS